MPNPTLLTSPIAENGEKNVIPATTGATTGLLDQEHGFQQINELPLQAGGLPPQRKDFNGAFNLLSKILFYAQKGYVFDFDENQDYYAGCVVKDTDGGLYCANVDVPASSTHPKDDTVNWSRYNSYALRSHSYALGDTSTLPNIPAGYFLECTTAGTTATTAPVVTPPVTAGQTISDGTAVWTVRRCLPTNGATVDGTLFRILLSGNTGLLSLAGGTTNTKAGTLGLYGIDIDDPLAGHFVLSAGTGSDVRQLVGSPAGDLNWLNNDLGGSAIVSKSLGTQGYIKYASGLIMEWGTVKLEQGTTSKDVSFSVSFTNVPVINLTSLAGTEIDKFGIKRGTASATQFTIESENSSLGYDKYFSWFAIGN